MTLRIRIALIALVSLLFTGGALTVAGPASATPVCSANYLCFHACPLSGSCGAQVQVAYNNTSCVNILQLHPNVISVRNRTSYRFQVFADTQCAGGADSYFYANTDGNMNWEWQGDGIGSIKRG